jgi:predicted transcriptional regulator
VAVKAKRSPKEKRYGQLQNEKCREAKSAELMTAAQAGVSNSYASGM